MCLTPNRGVIEREQLVGGGEKLKWDVLRSWLFE